MSQLGSSDFFIFFDTKDTKNLLVFTIFQSFSDTELMEDGYGLYSGVKLPAPAVVAAANHRSAPFALGSSTPGTGPPSDATRYMLK